MDTVALAIAVVAAVLSLVALAKTLSFDKRLQRAERQVADTKRRTDDAVDKRLPAAERQVKKTQQQIDEALDQRLATAEKQTVVAKRLAEEALALARDASRAPTSPTSAPARAVVEPETEPAPDVGPDPPDPKVRHRARKMLGEAKKIAMLISFDFTVKVGDKTGYRVPVKLASELDRRAFEYLQQNEPVVLDVAEDEGEYFLVLDTHG